jgi:hypothetical protein
VCWEFNVENEAHRIESWHVRLENGAHRVKNVTHTLELRSLRVVSSSARLVYHARRLKVASVLVEIRSVRHVFWPVSVNSDGSDAMINRAGTRIRASASSVGEAASGVFVRVPRRTFRFVHRSGGERYSACAKRFDRCLIEFDSNAVRCFSSVLLDWFYGARSL